MNGMYVCGFKKCYGSQKAKKKNNIRVILCTENCHETDINSVL